MTDPTILVTGFEPFGGDRVNPAEELAKAVDGRRFGDSTVRSAILPVHHVDACAAVRRLLGESDAHAVLHLGLAGRRSRVALERVAVNVMEYPLADNAGYRARGEACVPGGPTAYFATLPIDAILVALTAAGIPAYVSYTAGTYLCNQTLYTSLHAIAESRRPTHVGFMHFPWLPSMVAESGLDEPSMDFGLMLRAVETALAVIATPEDGARRDGTVRAPRPSRP